MSKFNDTPEIREGSGRSYELILGRRSIYLSVHALQRYYGRSVASVTRQDLQREIATAYWKAGMPLWANVKNAWDRARCEGHVVVGDGAFIVNRNASNDLVAVTYLRPIEEG